MNNRKNVLAVVLAALTVAPAWSQTTPATDGNQAGHDKHHGHGESVAPNPAPEGKGGTMGAHEAPSDNTQERAPSKEGMAHKKGMSDMKGMGHMHDMAAGAQRMPTGSETNAQADLRDPHAYSGGHTLESGPYALPGPRQLRLADEHNFASLLVDRFERSFGRDSNETAYEVQGWFGRDYDRLVIKAEGDITGGEIAESRTEALWGHAIANYWDTQLGVRVDTGPGPNRTWLALGVQGLAPYWFEVDATAYVGNSGRTALRVGVEYELLLTQRLVLQPRAEANFYGKSDTERDIGGGLSDATAGLRLRYEVTRQVAPYVGVEWTGKFGNTKDLVRAAGERTSDTRVVAGLRFWF